jgi:sulfite reductase (NADPH) hemoprotein beta-component
MEKTVALQVVTANKIGDGTVVYLTRDGGWSEWITDGRVSRSDEERDELMAVARASAEKPDVVEPYVIDVVEDAGVIRPVRYREEIRAQGPTIHPAFGKQAAGG